MWGFCDVNTGQCCEPGGNCTICPLGYRVTENGCEFCGDCVKRLLATAKALDYNITEVCVLTRTCVTKVCCCYGH